MYSNNSYNQYGNNNSYSGYNQNNGMQNYNNEPVSPDILAWWFQNYKVADLDDYCNQSVTFDQNECNRNSRLVQDYREKAKKGAKKRFMMAAGAIAVFVTWIFGIGAVILAILIIVVIQDVIKNKHEEKYESIFKKAYFLPSIKYIASIDHYVYNQGIQTPLTRHYSDLIQALNVIDSFSSYNRATVSDCFCGTYQGVSFISADCDFHKHSSSGKNSNDYPIFKGQVIIAKLRNRVATDITIKTRNFLDDKEFTKFELSTHARGISQDLANRIAKKYQIFVSNNSVANSNDYITPSEILTPELLEALFNMRGLVLSPNFVFHNDFVIILMNHSKDYFEPKWLDYRKDERQIELRIQNEFKEMFTPLDLIQQHSHLLDEGFCSSNSFNPYDNC